MPKKSNLSSAKSQKLQSQDKDADFEELVKEDSKIEDEVNTIDDQDQENLETKDLNQESEKPTSEINDQPIEQKSQSTFSLLKEKRIENLFTKEFPPFLFASILIIIATILSLALYVSIKNSNYKEYKDLKRDVSSNKVEQSSSSGSLVIEGDKQLLSVKVLNGSGVKGLAAEIKDDLVDLGYKEVEVGNADTKQSVTTVEFSAKISSDQLKEIENYLKEKFDEIELVEMEDSTSDLLITTGKLTD